MPSSRTNGTNGRHRAWMHRAIFLAALLLIWHVLATMGIWESVLFPAPLAVGRSILAAVWDGSLLEATLASLQRLGLGYVLSLAMGIPLGLLLGRIRLVDHTVGALALGLQALPSICWLPLAILWFGLGETGILFVVVIGSVMAVSQAVRDGVRTIPPLLMRAARMLGASPRQAYTQVVLPASLPAALSGARMGWSFAWRSLMAAELIYVDRGLGAMLSTGRELHDMARVVGVMLLIMALGLAAERLAFGRLEKTIRRRWGHLAASDGWGL